MLEKALAHLKGKAILESKTQLESNMSYCRFENTSKDLQDCVDALDEMSHKGDLGSDYEVDGAKDIRKLCDQYIDKYDSLDEDTGELHDDEEDEEEDEQEESKHLESETDPKAPASLTIKVSGPEEANSKWEFGEIVASAKQFSTGSKGFYASGKVVNPESQERYQCTFQAVLVGSKPKKEESKLLEAKKEERGTCPVCGNTKLEYGNVDSVDGFTLYDFECPSCETQGTEDYEQKFVGYTISYKGNKEKKGKKEAKVDSSGNSSKELAQALIAGFISNHDNEFHNFVDEYIKSEKANSEEVWNEIGHILEFSEVK